jgi:hypothetical protein
MAKRKKSDMQVKGGAQGVQVTEVGGGKTVWTEVAKVAIKRGVNERGDPPLMLTLHVASGSLPNGRKFNVALNLSSGSLVFTIEAAPDIDGGEKDAVYIVDAQDTIAAIFEARSPR